MNTTDARSNGRKNKSVIKSIPPARLRHYWNNVIIPDAMAETFGVGALKQECWMLPPNNRGYYRISLGHAKSKLPAHHVALWTKTGRRGVSPETTASHLCHHKNCCNPDHIIEESIIENNARKGCVAHFKKNGVYYNVCPHQPRCVLRDTTNLPDDFRVKTVKP